MAYCAVSNPHRVRIFEVLPSGSEARWGSDLCEASKADYMLRVDSTNSKLWVHHENRPEQKILLMDLSLNVGDTFDIVRYALDGITNGVVARRGAGGTIVVRFGFASQSHNAQWTTALTLGY